MIKKMATILAVLILATGFALSSAPRAEAHWRGGGWVAGIAAGVIGAALLSPAWRRHHYYGGYYGYGYRPYYASSFGWYGWPHWRHHRHWRRW